MGLGKTAQAVALLDYLCKKEHIRGPFLVVAPLSTIPHWKREIESWTEMNCIIHHGSCADREMIKKYEWFYPENTRIGNVPHYKFNILITTYEIMRADKHLLQTVDWVYLIVDEAHRFFYIQLTCQL